MSALVVLSSSSAWLLLGAGIMKIAKPEGTAPAITTLTGLNRAVPAARGLGVVEVAIAAGFLVAPTWWASVLIGVWYLGLLAAARVLRGKDADCGCFGARPTEVSVSHLLVTALLGSSGVTLALIDGAVASGASYALIASSVPAAIGWYALLSPLPALRTSISQLAR